MISNAAHEELIRLVELDREGTGKFIESIVGTGTTVRGWTITLVLALLGLAFDRRLWELGVLAGFVVVAFGFVDVYHSWLYSQALRHARSIDRVLQLYYVSLARGKDDPDAVEEFEVELEAYRFGLAANLVPFRFSSVLSVRPRFVLATIHLTLLVAAVLTTLTVAILARTSDATLQCSPSGDPKLGIFVCLQK